jgi:G3E family GTPase
MIKVDIVSGFLGAGKTTLIKKILIEYKKERLVLIENEFGEIGIDGDLIEREGFEVYEISNGCICCIMQRDFVNLILRVIKEFKPERIIIEPTGISILSEVIEVLNKAEFSKLITINSLVTVVDCLNYLEQCDLFGEFFEDQIINAKTLILSKSQFVKPEKIEEIVNSLKKLNPEGIIINSSWDKLSFNQISSLTMDEIKMDFKDLFHTEYKPCRENEFDTFAIETRKKVSKAELDKILKSLGEPLYGKVLRGKGFLKAEEGLLEFSYTNGQYDILESNFSASGKLCLIGKNLNENELKRLFNVKDGGIFNWLKF